MTDGSPSRASSNGLTFEPVTRETLSSQIRDRLLERITSGGLEPGAQVPSERSLSEQFGVARTSVREAMQGLLSLGVVVRRGNRSYVAEKLPDVSFDQIDDRKQFITQLFETRRLLEVPMIELAAERATDAERNEISEIAAGFSPDMTLGSFRELDRRFHTALGPKADPIVVEAIVLAFTGALLQSGIGLMTYTEMGERLNAVVTVILKGNV